MNAYTRAAVWARFMAGALAALADGEGHVADRVFTAARVADYALDEYVKRFTKKETA
jgi:hypothetical protein